jgi:ribonuclease HIII
MNAVLNFSGKSKKQILEFLEKHENLGAKSEFEEFRAKILDCNATLFKSGKLLIQGNSTEKVKELILENVKAEDELILGIDETGRGESFGPLVVAGVLGTTSSLREFRDSKKIPKAKIPEKSRLAMQKSKWLVEEIPSTDIDALREIGKNLNAIEANAINKIIRHFQGIEKRKFKIIIDGSSIKGIVKGVKFLPKADDLIVQCAAASIIAKNSRNESKDKGKRKSWKSRKYNA